MNSRISYITFNLPLLVDYMATFACRGISGDVVLKIVLEQLLASHIVWVLLEQFFAYILLSSFSYYFEGNIILFSKINVT